jgi:hypothetical protein
MKANVIQMYLDMYSLGQISRILERETEKEKLNLKNKIKELIEESNLDIEQLFEKIDKL